MRCTSLPPSLSLEKKKRKKKRKEKKKKNITGAFQVKVYGEGGGAKRGLETLLVERRRRIRTAAVW